MVYILAAIGAITVAILLWRAFGRQAVEAATRSGNGRSRTVAPDDDPEFLRKLSEDQRKRRSDEP